MYLHSLQHRETKENNPDVRFEFTPENLKVRKYAINVMLGNDQIKSVLNSVSKRLKT
jgi:hypothetical protein